VAESESAFILNQAKAAAEKESTDIINLSISEAQKERERIVAEALIESKRVSEAERSQALLKARQEAEEIISSAKTRVSKQLEESSRLMLEIQQKMQQVIGAAGIEFPNLPQKRMKRHPPVRPRKSSLNIWQQRTEKLEAISVRRRNPSH
jgi:vacuolar-type H+-ATPase subunit H